MIAADIQCADQRLLAWSAPPRGPRFRFHVKSACRSHSAAARFFSVGYPMVSRNGPDDPGSSFK